MKHCYRLLALLSLAVLSGLPTAQAVTICTDSAIPPSNPDSVYTVISDGTVLDRRNGLLWKRCAEGQSGANCSGSATAHTWSAALSLAASSTFAGYSDWRLPNVKELKSLVEKCRYAPSINHFIFPATSSSYFWSGSPYAYVSSYAWFVSFSNGSVNYYGFRYGANQVRLVRGGQSFDSFDLATQQAITLGSAPSLLVGGTAALSATGGASGLPVIFSSKTPAVCGVSGSSVTGVARGSCTVAANQAGDSFYTPADEKTQSFPVTSVPSQVIDNLLQNSGFEGGATVWSQSSKNSYPLIVADPAFPSHAGSYYAYLGGYDNASDFIEQSLAIPANSKPASLEFWTQITTQETSCCYDALTVALYSSSGSYLGTLTTLSGQNASSGWVKNSGFDLTGYQGQTVRLRFTATTNASNNTRFLIDDVKLSATVLYTQSIAFDAAPTVVEGLAGTLSASASSGLPVSFTSNTTRTCTIAGNTVTGVSPGTCTIAANQAGDTGYLAAPSATQSFTITATNAVVPPGPPAITSATSGRGSAKLTLSPPANNGGAPLVAYAASCAASGQATKTASGPALTLTVRGMKGGVSYACTATANNGFHTSSASAPMSVTPQAGGGMTSIMLLLLD